MEKITQKKVAILTSHPIQYQAPLFQLLAKEKNIDLTVYFCWDFGVKESYDKEFGKSLTWDIPLLDGYGHKFLRNYSLNPSSGFWGQINPGIIRELLIGRYDAIIILGWNSFTNWLAFFVAKLCGTKILLRSENPMNQELLKPAWKRTIKKIIFGRILFLMVSAFLYIGQQNKKFYEYYNVPEKKLFFAPYAVDNDRLIKAHKKLKGEKEKLRKEMGIEKDAFVILFVGKLIEKKRPMDLLRAYQQLITNDSGLITNLVFVGDGALRKELEQYTKEHHIPDVYFEGFKNQTELPIYYTIADVFVLPSGEGETWGLVVNEAMCFGLPAIVSDMVGCGEDLIMPGENGFNFKLGDIMALKENLKRVYEKNISEKISIRNIEKYNYRADLSAILNIFLFLI